MAKSGDTLSLQARTPDSSPQLSRQGLCSRAAAAGQVGRSEPRLKSAWSWSCRDPLLWYDTFPLGRKQSTERQEGAFLGERSCVFPGCVLKHAYSILGGVNDRSYRSHGKESTMSDNVLHKSEALAWLVYRRFPGIDSHVAQPEHSRQR